jgi:hypothetical protein
MAEREEAKLTRKPGGDARRHGGAFRAVHPSAELN